MNRLWIYISLLLVLLGCSSDKTASLYKPNIVFIFADDLSYTAINALGNKEIHTPNLNRLASMGTTFTHAYNMGAWNGAVCVASRAMIISGRSVWNANNFRQNWLRAKEMDKSWGKLMEAADYETYMTGKWHVDAPADSVFQNVVHVRPGMPRDSWNDNGQIPYINALRNAGASQTEIKAIGYNRPLSEKDSSWSPTDVKYGGFWEGGKHWSEVLKEDALGFIDRAKNRNKPFFMYLAFNAPHDPRQAPQAYLDQYPLENIGIPESWLPEYPYKDSIGNGRDLRDEALAPYPRTEYVIKKHTQEYYALISHLDDQIGEILDKLETSGTMEHTVVIFTADHGLAMGRHGLMGKQSLFDHSIRAPFMIVGPGIPQGKKIDTDIYIQDAMATSLDLAGIPRPDYLFFHSIIPILKGAQQTSSYDAIYGAYMTSQRMIRKDGFKLIVYPNVKKFLLFDMANDPEEIHDLAQDDRYKTKVRELFEALLQLQKSLNDHVDLTELSLHLDQSPVSPN